MAFRRNLRRLDFWRCNVRVIASVAFLSVAIMTSQSRTVSATDKLDFQFFDVSLPALSLGPEERVSAFNCEVRGAIVRVNSPLLWNLSLDGATGGRSYLKANAVVGAAFLSGPYLRYFDKFMTVGKGSSWDFDVTVTLTIVDTDSGQERTLC